MIIMYTGSPSPQYEKVTKLTSDAKFEDGDIKSSLAALTFVLSSAAKHSVDGQSLDNELQQLGLPKGTYGFQSCNMQFSSGLCFLQGGVLM